MRLAVFGSRSLSGSEVALEIRQTISDLQVDAIVTAGEPDGVCATAQEVARAVPLPLTLHFLDFHHLRGAFDHRSRAIIADSDFVLLVHDGVSKGTANEYKLVQKLQKPHRYVTMTPSGHSQYTQPELEPATL